MIRRLSSIALLLITTSALAQGSITTSGSADILVEPDQVEFTVGVETMHVSLEMAKQLNDAAVAKTIAAAKRNGVPAAAIQTDYISIEPNYDYEHRERLTPTSYVVRRSIVITSKDIPNFERLLSALVEAGANRVRSIRFMTTKLREHRDTARRMAAKAALEKAQLLAETLGGTVGKATQISEANDWWSSSYASWWGGNANVMANVSQNVNVAGGDTNSDSPLAPGRIAVKATVNVTFAFY
jgi:uncharacterized protein YggE